MKTSMKMLDNGNYEAVVDFVQHDCQSKDRSWRCVQYSTDMQNLTLTVGWGDPYEDGCEHVTEVPYCPFCGFSPSKKSC